MKKLFGQKAKVKASSGSRDSAEEIPKPSQVIPTPLFEKLATYGIRTEEDRSQAYHRQLPSISVPSPTSSFASLPPGTSPPLGSSVVSPKSASPTNLVSTATNMSTTQKLSRQHDGDTRKKNQSTAPVTLSILRALDPPRPETKIASTRSQPEERYTVSDSGHLHRDAGEKKEKRGFWHGRDKEREKEKEREREREIMLQREKDSRREKDRGPERGGDRLGERERNRGREIWAEEEGTAKLTHMIGFLTATAAQDWTLLMDVCDRASASESNAKAAVRALKYEFKYAAPPAQLSAARLWAIMLRNSSDIFISQSTSRKFLDTLEELITSPKTSPVVRERLLEVIAAAAFASGNKKDSRHEKDGFRGLWKRVKPFDKPDEGIPFDTDDAMFQPPNTGQGPGFDVPFISYQEPSPLPVDSAPRANVQRNTPVRNRIIPPDEDMRRLLEECAFGRGNAGLLSEALAHSDPEDLKKKDVIREFYDRCRSSQELICAQIPWASAGAENSRVMKDKADRTNSNESNLEAEDGRVPVEQTVEENLLAALLVANAELVEALKQYEDLERVAIERQTEERSRKEIRMERKHRDLENLASLELSASNTSSRPSTPRSRPHTPQQINLVHPLPRHPEPDNDSVFLGQNLAHPPAAPQGPRSLAPISLHTRTPSPGTPGLPYVNGYDVHDDTQMPSPNGFGEEYSSAKPSAKALGKRRVVEPDNSSDPLEDISDMFDKENAFAARDGADPGFEDEIDHWHHPAVHFVYDAVAERTRQRLEGIQELVDNRVH